MSPKTSLLIVVFLSISARAALGADFEREIAPIIISRCLECHDSAQRKGGLDLTTREGMIKGGESGQVIVEREPAKSRLWQRVHSGEMPPESKGQPDRLPELEIRLLREWIAAGAVWPASRRLDLYERTSHVRAGKDWWSLLPVQRPEPATIGNDAEGTSRYRFRSRSRNRAPRAAATE